MIVMAKNKSDQKRRIENVLSALKHDKLAIASLVFLVIIIALALLAPILPLDPNTTDVRNMFQPPSPEHWFGTDDIGRDYLSRVIYGGRVSLLVGFLAMITCVCVGVLVGTVSGYCGGWIDSILMRIVDIMSSIPWMVLVTVISLFLKRGLKSIIIVIGFFTWMEIARLVRAETLSLKEREYVMYAKFVGICDHFEAYYSFRASDNHYCGIHRHCQCDHDRVFFEFPGTWYPAADVFMGKSSSECPELYAECDLYGDSSGSSDCADNFCI